MKQSKFGELAKRALKHKIKCMVAKKNLKRCWFQVTKEEFILLEEYWWTCKTYSDRNMLRLAMVLGVRKFFGLALRVK